MHRSLAVAAVLSITALSHAQTGFSDNFNDGNDLGWTRSRWGDNYNQSWSVLNGEYRHRTLQATPNDGGTGLISLWATSLNNLSAFDNGVLTAKVRVINAGTSASLFLRSDLSFNAYNMVLSPTTGRAILYVFDGEFFAELGHLDVPGGITLGTSYHLWASAVGPWISMKVWRDGDPEPTAPQVRAHDIHHASGALGVFSYVSAMWQAPALIDARYDDVSYLPVSYCPGDFDGDGAVDLFDYDAFVAAFEIGAPESDFDADGTVDFFDYDAFVAAFESGC